MRKKLTGGDQQGFTLIELLIVVAIIGIIASIAIPNLMNATDRAKQSSTMGDMRALGLAIEKYAVDNNNYPLAADIAELAPLLEPDYIKRAPTRDAWGNALVFTSGAGGSGYTLASCGKDGVCAGSPAGGATSSFEADIIYIDGTFVQHPAGRQQ